MELLIALVSLLSATITAVFGFLGQLALSSKKRREDEAKEARQLQYMEDRDDYFEEKLKIIDKKLDQHNNYAKRFESVDIKLTGMQKDIDYLLKKKGVK